MTNGKSTKEQIPFSIYYLFYMENLDTTCRDNRQYDVIKKNEK